MLLSLHFGKHYFNNLVETYGIKVNLQPSYQVKACDYKMLQPYTYTS